DATVTEGDAAMEEKQSPTEEVQQDRGPANPSTSKAEPLDGDILPGNQDGDNDEEAREKGVISRRVCTGYAKAVGVGVSTMVLLSLLFMQLSRNASDWWLAQWSAEATLLQGAASAAHVGAPWDGWSDSEFLLIYGVICAANSLFTLFRAFFFAFGGLRGARRMHSSLLQSIMQAPMSFFDRTPTGRLINRFGRDVFTVDESLPFQLNIFLAQSFSLFGSLLVLGISTRGMLLVI
ncbi:ABCC13, partial [Symbiodinium sp. KB8]